MHLIKVWSYGRQGSNLLIDYLSTLPNSVNLGELFSINHGTKKLTHHFKYINEIYGSDDNTDLYNQCLINNMRNNPSNLLLTLNEYFAMHNKQIIIVKIMVYDYSFNDLQKLIDLPGINIFLRRNRINTYISKCKKCKAMNTNNYYSGCDYSDVTIDWNSKELFLMLNWSSKYRKLYHYCNYKKIIDYEKMSNLGISYISNVLPQYTFNTTYVTKRKKQNNEKILENNFTNPEILLNKLKNKKLKYYFINSDI